MREAVETGGWELISLLEVALRNDIPLKLKHVLTLIESGISLDYLHHSEKIRVEKQKTSVQQKSISLTIQVLSFAVTSRMYKKTLYHLLLVNQGLKETDVRTLYELGIEYEDLKTMTYPKFSYKSRDWSRRNLYERMMISYIALEEQGLPLVAEVDLSTIGCKKSTSDYLRQTTGVIEKDVRKAYEEILFVYDELDHGFTVDDLKMRTGIKKVLLRKAINRLCHDGFLMYRRGVIHKEYRSISILMHASSEKTDRILRDHLSGQTFASIGKREGFSRQRAKQLFDYRLKTIPASHFIETYIYGKYFEYGGMSYSFFEKVLLEKKQVYLFLSYKLGKGEKSTMDLQEGLRDEEKLRFLDYLSKDMDMASLME